MKTAAAIDYRQVRDRIDAAYRAVDSAAGIASVDGDPTDRHRQAANALRSAIELLENRGGQERLL